MYDADTLSAEPTYVSDDERWDAVRSNNSRADTVFLYAVVTTGIYCRPSCTSRLPMRGNVRYYDEISDAEKAGFRPCKRCTPDRAKPVSRETERIAKACRLIEASRETLTLHQLASQVCVSPHHFHRLFKKHVGVTPRQYATAQRDRRLKSSLAAHESVTNTMQEAGFESSGHFYGTVDDSLGMTPSRYRDGGSGTTVRFAVGECALGHILVAGTLRGVCAITLGDNPHELVRRLQDQFSKATLVGDDADFQAHVARLVAFVDTPSKGIDLPLDIQGTAFQRRVWNAMRHIPVGETASYAEIARRIGKPSSSRAVAGACAANQLALAIPCHRVVRTDGTLSGYRWGVERKREMLDREAAS